MTYDPAEFGNLTLDEQVEALFPIDGPYDDETTKSAARAIGSLVRYLNHAGWSANAYSYPSTVSSVVGNLSGAVSMLDQATRQMSGWLVKLAEHRDAYDDRGGDPAATARAAVAELEQARARLDEAQRALQRAHRYTDRLGLDAASAKYHRERRAAAEGKS